MAQAATFKIDSTRSLVRQSGEVDVARGGRAGIDGESMESTGLWRVAQGGQLGFGSGGFFSQGEIHNEGDLVFTGHATFGEQARWVGRGTVSVLRGSWMTVAGDLDIGSLVIGQPARDFAGSYAFSGVRVEGAATLDRLHWGDGSFETAGPVAVRGQATLSNNQADWEGEGMGDVGGVPEGRIKHLKSAFRFEGGVVWDGNADLRGPGSIHVAAGTVFEDHNTKGTFDVDTTNQRVYRPTEVAVASCLNEGRYEKTGAGQTVIESALENRGTVRVVDAGTLTLAGAVDNRGRLEAVRSRLVVYGPLAQYAPGPAGGRLAGGSYAVDDGVLVFNLGTARSGRGPALIQAIGQGARIELKGSGARIATAWLGSDVDALSQLGPTMGSWCCSTAPGSTATSPSASAAR